MKTPQAPAPQLTDDSSFGFASGRVRALETQLLDRSRYERLARCADAAEFLSALADTPYGRFIEPGARADFDAALDRAGQENRAFLAEYARGTGWLVSLFGLAARVRDLKRAVKTQLSRPGEEAKPARELAAAAFAGEGPELVAAAAAAAADALGGFERDHDPTRVDCRLDRLEQELGLSLAAESELLSDYYSLRADVENLRTLVRLKAAADAGEQRAELSAALLPGGAVPPAEFVALLATDWGALAARFAGTALAPLAQEGAEQAAKQRSLVRLERLGREALLSLLRRTRYAVTGHEVLVAYHLLRENEISNLRRLYAARVAGFGAEAALELFAWVA